MALDSKNALGFVLLLAALCASCPERVCSQSATPPPGDLSPPSSTEADPWVPSVRSLGKDALDIVRGPFNLSPSQRLLALGSVGLLASTAAAVDQPAFQRMSVRSGTVSQTTRPLAAPGRWYDRVGPDRAALGTAGLLAVSGIALQRRTLTRTSVRVAEALVYTKLLTGLGKSALNRSRPFAASGPGEADPGAFSSDHNKLSMPSGHTARAFAVASVLSHQFDQWYVSVPSYGMAASVGVERVRSGDHWLTDVMVGGAIGYFIGRAVTPDPSDRGDVTYTPILSTDRIGLSVSF